MTSGPPDRQGRALRLLPLVLAVLCGVATLLVWRTSRLAVQRAEAEDLERRASEAATHIEEEAQRHLDLLRAASALFASSEVVEPEELTAFFGPLDLSERYPGVRSAFVVRPGGLGTGPTGPPPRGSVETAYPSLGTRDDLAASPGFAELLDRATTSGGPVLGEPRSSGSSAAWLAVLTLPDGDGWIGLEIDGQEFLGGLAADLDPTMAVELHDWTGRQTLTLASTPALTPGGSQRTVVATLSPVGGRQWHLQVTGPPSPAVRDREREPWLLLVGGLGLAIGIVTTSLLQNRSRRSAVELAARAERGEERLRAHFDRASVGQAVLDLDGRFIEVNHELADLMGFDAGAMAGMALADITHPDDREQLAAVLAQLRAESIGESRFEARFTQRHGGTIDASTGIATVYDESGRPGSFVVVLQDITTQRLAQAELADLALHDPLTGLANRMLMMDRLERLLARRDAGGSPIGVLMIDLDDFKLVNDSFGHGSGDRLLREVGTRISRSVRFGDTVARIGGDEFVVLCPELSDAKEAVVVAERILDAVSRPVALPEGEVVVMPSIGIAVSPATDAHALLRDADAAMYRAKKRGRSRVEVYDESLRQAITTRLRIQTELRSALKHGQLRLVYQPIVAVDTGRIVGAEALVRWAHPERGLLAPSEFLQVAEDSGLVVPLGRWVLERACRDGASWTAGRVNPPYVSVNLSARELADPALVPELERCLSSSGLAPGRLVVEVSETTLMRDLAPVTAAVGALDQLGVRLAIDDFGTGYSSFVYLKRCPVHALKIDRTFIAGLGDDEACTAIVTSAVSLAHALGIAVVAQGVEQATQVSLLRLLGCQHGQGYVWAEPVPVDGLLQLMDPGSPMGEPPARALPGP